MMKTCLILLFLNTLLTDHHDQRVALMPIEYRFRNGHAGFETFIRQNLNLSDTSCCYVGNSISRITLTSDGLIRKIAIVNPIDSITDSEICRAILNSERYWKKCDTILHDQIFYIQVAISTTQFMPEVYKPVSQALKSIFVDPVVIIRYNTSHEYDFPFISNEQMSEKLNNFLKTEEYGEALQQVNELIRRAPFNRELYRTRIMINYRLDRKEQVVDDNDRLMDFAEGYSLDDLLKDKKSGRK